MSDERLKRMASASTESTTKSVVGTQLMSVCAISCLVCSKKLGGLSTASVKSARRRTPIPTIPCSVEMGCAEKRIWCWSGVAFRGTAR